MKCLHTRCKDISLEYFDDWETLKRECEEYGDEKGCVDKQWQRSVLRNCQHEQLRNVITVAEVAERSKRAQDEKYQVHVGVNVVVQKSSTAYHAAVDWQYLHAHRNGKVLAKTMMQGWFFHRLKILLFRQANRQDLIRLLYCK